jgi:hypothetical protein
MCVLSWEVKVAATTNLVPVGKSTFEMIYSLSLFVLILCRFFVHGVYGQTTVLDLHISPGQYLLSLSVHYDHISDNALFLLS